jgi:hypothetical protein
MNLPRSTRQFGFVARLSAAASLTLIGLAIVTGSLGVDSEDTIGSVLFPALGVAALVAGASAFFTGVAAILRDHDRTAGTIVVAIGGALLSWFMIVELLIE